MPPLLLAASALPVLAVGAPVKVDAGTLAGLPTAQAILSAHGVSRTCEGPVFTALLARLGLPQGEGLHGAALARGIVVRARDGYQVLLSLGELDASLGNEPAIIATSCDGKPLASDEGPYRLILPHDGRPARSERQVAEIELM